MYRVKYLDLRDTGSLEVFFVSFYMSVTPDSKSDLGAEKRTRKHYSLHFIPTSEFSGIFVSV